jgi:hypothetical protein
MRVRERVNSRVHLLRLAFARQARRLGLDPDRVAQRGGLSAGESRILEAVERYTMTSPARVLAVCDAVRYLDRNRVRGAIVECGVWRGGAIMAAALTLAECGDTERELYLYDTFAGMTEPGEDDVDRRGRDAHGTWVRMGGRGDSSEWCVSTAAEVRANVESTGYPPARIHLVEGRVEDTMPATLPGSIALLRLDTDWYESTRHELEHLVPLIEPGGVLQIDDYGHWEGARRAVDEYLDRTGLPLLLARTDYTGRMAVMPGLARPG